MALTASVKRVGVPGADFVGFEHAPGTLVSALARVVARELGLAAGSVRFYAVPEGREAEAEAADVADEAAAARLGARLSSLKALGGSSVLLAVGLPAARAGGGDGDGGAVASPAAREPAANAAPPRRTLLFSSSGSSSSGGGNSRAGESLPVLVATAAGDIVVDGALFAQGQPTASLHLCTLVAAPLDAPLCIKLYAASAEAEASALREAACGGAIREAFPGHGGGGGGGGGGGAPEHPAGLVRFIAAGRLASGRHFFVMPFYALSLANVISHFLRPARRGLPARPLAQLALGLADALVALHSLGLAHCDVKPANVMLRGDGAPVLIDLAAATRFGERPAEVTRRWVVADSDEAGAALVLTASPALDLHGLAATVFSAMLGDASEVAVRRLPAFDWARGGESGADATAVAKTCWAMRGAAADDLARALRTQLHALPAE
jgi:hypothetical protein